MTDEQLAALAKVHPEELVEAPADPEAKVADTIN